MTETAYLKKIEPYSPNSPGSELVLKERRLMYNTLSLFSNENGKRESSHQKRRDVRLNGMAS